MSDVKEIRIFKTDSGAMRIQVETGAAFEPQMPNLSADEIEFALKTLSTMFKAVKEKNMPLSSEKDPKAIMRERAKMLASIGERMAKKRGKEKFH